MAFHAFTNGTLIDEEFCREMLRVGNFFVSISVEGFEAANDGRRGQGHFQKALDAMDLMHSHRIPFGVSICYTSRNYKVVTSDDFLDLLISKGCVFAWYFHYMPVGLNADTSLLLTPEQRAYMKDRVREIRGIIGGKELYCIDFQNDGEFAGGCVAGGRIYCHINAAGDVEPCVFIHYSSANIREKSFLECLQQPLFKLYRQGQPFNGNHLRPSHAGKSRRAAEAGGRKRRPLHRSGGTGIRRAPVRKVQGLRRMLEARGRKTLGGGALLTTQYTIHTPFQKRPAPYPFRMGGWVSL